MKKPTWIVFDIGGVLLDWPTSSAEAAKLLNIDRGTLFDVLFDQTVEMSIGAKMNIGALSAHEGWTEVLKRLQKEHAPQEIISRWYAEEFWLEDTLKLVTELKTAGYKLAVMSNSWLGLTDPSKQTVLPQELQLFDYIFDSSQEKMKKPDGNFYDLVEKSIQATGEDILFIDDDEKNINIAEQRHWRTYLYDMADDKGVNANNFVRGITL